MKSAKDLQAAFDAFNAQHPGIYQEFKRRVNQLWNTGCRHYSADGILHTIRFHTTLSGKDKEPFKINNNYSAFFARKWQAEFPERKDFFETRVQKSVTLSTGAHQQYL